MNNSVKRGLIKKMKIEGNIFPKYIGFFKDGELKNSFVLVEHIYDGSVRYYRHGGNYSLYATRNICDNLFLDTSPLFCKESDRDIVIREITKKDYVEDNGQWIEKYSYEKIQ